MKPFLKNITPKIAISLVLVFLVTNVLTIAYSKIKLFILVYPANLQEPWQWYRLLTHPFYGAGLLNWVILVFMMIGSGFLVEKHLEKKQIWTLILSATVIGGASYMYLHRLDDFDPPMGSPAFIGWAYVVTAFILGLTHWKTSGLFEKIWVGVSVLLLINFCWNDHKLKNEIIIVILFAVFLNLFRIFREKKKNTIFS